MTTIAEEARAIPSEPAIAELSLREARGRGQNPSFRTLARLTAARLRALRYEQTPALVGPTRRLGQSIPWVRRRPGRRGTPRRA